jgi:hypothetical protein
VSTFSSRSQPFAIALASLVALGFALLAATSRAEDGSVDPAYTVYGACGLLADSGPSHLCHKGDSLGAFFRSESTDVRYDVCVDFPLVEKRLCSTNQEAQAGVLYVNKITSGVEGKTTITWYVNSTQVGTWTFGLYRDPVVPKFGINPLFFARQHRLYGFLIRHGGNGSRVRAWTTCGTGNICPLGLRRVAVHEGIRRYIVSAPPHGAYFELGRLLYVLVDAPGETDGHGSQIWGRLYTGKFVRAPHGKPGDTALRHLGELKCVPPGKGYSNAIGCDRVP